MQIRVGHSQDQKADGCVNLLSRLRILVARFGRDICIGTYGNPSKALKDPE